MQAMQDYSWPGNVRELQTTSAGGRAGAGDELTRELLPEAVLGGRPQHIGAAAAMWNARFELVQQGVETAGSGAENLYAAIVNRVERELIAGDGRLRGVQIKAANASASTATRCTKSSRNTGWKSEDSR